MTLATVVLPTFDHGGLLRFPLRCALTQTVQDLEVLIIGDGVSAADSALIRELAATDPRVRFLEHPKHERRGEPYRHAALQTARGRIVCYLTDRDLWLPDHVEHMASLLASADVAGAFSVHVMPGDARTGAGEHLRYHVGDLAAPWARAHVLAGPRRNFVAFSCLAHTLDLYRRLPHGWHTTPPEHYTDAYFLQQMLRVPGVRAASGVHPTAVTFPSPPRAGRSREERLWELERWAARLETDAGRAGVRAELLESALRQATARVLELEEAREQMGVLASLREVRRALRRWLRAKVGRA